MKTKQRFKQIQQFTIRKKSLVHFLHLMWQTSLNYLEAYIDIAFL